MNAIIIDEEYWKNSQLSVARFYGKIQINGHLYIIVNKEGIDVIQLSDPRSPHYVEGPKVIPEGEPCDLVRVDWIPVYQALGREKTIELVKAGTSLEDAKKMMHSKL